MGTSYYYRYLIIAEQRTEQLKQFLVSFVALLSRYPLQKAKQANSLTRPRAYIVFTPSEYQKLIAQNWQRRDLLLRIERQFNCSQRTKKKSLLAANKRPHIKNSLAEWSTRSRRNSCISRDR